MPRAVEVIPYDPAWETEFRIEAETLRAVLGDELLAIHHIGSTSVPGLSAKPIIDLIPEVRDIARLERYDGQMTVLGYTPLGEYGIPNRRYYYKGNAERHSHHVHAYQAGNLEIQRHLAFRDYLRAHPAEAAAYGSLKEELARRFPTDIDAYIEGKDRFVKEMEQKALYWKKGGL